MKTLVIEREALRHNIGVIKERAGQAVIYAVLTGDGHGAGLVELARVLREEGIGRFAVSEPAEAAALRKAGFVEEEILMLRPTVDREELAQLIELNVVCTVGSSDTGMALNAAAEERSTVVEAHIQIDTGMGFGGFLADEPEKILSVYRNLPNVAISGICTQIQVRKKDGRDLTAQLEQLRRAGAPSPPRSPWAERLLRQGKLTHLDRATVAEVIRKILVFEDRHIEITYAFSNEQGLLDAESGRTV